MNSISRKNLLYLVLTFTGLWLLYFVTEIITGRIKGIDSFLINLLIPSIFMALAGFLVWLFSIKHPDKFSIKTISISIVLLVLSEQFIKFIIRSGFEDMIVELIPDWLYFSPVLNTNGSWAASRYGMNLGFNVFIMINIIGLILLLQIYRFHVSRKPQNFFTDSVFILIISGAICSLIDKLFFGGSLDYIGIDQLFVADLKDFYLTFSIAILISYFLQTGTNEETSIKDDLNLFKEFIAFCFKFSKIK